VFYRRGEGGVLGDFSLLGRQYKFGQGELQS